MIPRACSSLTAWWCVVNMIALAIETSSASSSAIANHRAASRVRAACAGVSARARETFPQID